MEQLANLIVCFLMISTIGQAYSYPAPSDILSGSEFLSLLMQPEGRNSGGSIDSFYSSSEVQRPLVFRGSRKYQDIFLEQNADEDNEDSILPIEALFTSRQDLGRSLSRTFGHRTRYRSRNGKYSSTTTTTTSTTTTTTEIPSVTEDLEVAASEISFQVEEVTDEELQGSTTVIATTMSELEEASTVSESTTSPISKQPQEATTELQSSISDELLHLNTEERSVDSKSFLSRLTIEESSPSIGLDDVGGSKISAGSIQTGTKSPDSNTGQPLRGRMQRKQDTAVPRQTVIYHDKKTDNDQHHSVSYSYMGETAPNLKTWKDIDQEYLANSKQPSNASAENPISTTVVPNYQEPAKFWSEPEKNYSEPAKVWSQPARIYSEPAKFYSEPAKIYSEPARIYSEPAKIYSKPSSYWQTLYDNPPKSSPSSTESPSQKRIVFNELDKIPYDELNAPADAGNPSSIHNAIGKFIPKQPQQQQVKKISSKPTPDPTEIVDPYVEKKVNGNGSSPSVLVQTLAPNAGSPEDSKVGYVVEGRNYRKYRVEEKTPDGFIVGEYGVLSHNDGNLRGVRYTAESDINPRLIYDALLKFLSL
ncbi:uncharacterized protein LOC129753130 [Uranotaenia lowii]|uniref:uncharacterized protein LOC129753130 n=1 Tax=Uranotaenia lowii TaxID=190385 RepID=UPI00247A7D6A|nr:uncharacterized protein LOC129753130 [Uranotaenia lowii]